MNTWAPTESDINNVFFEFESNIKHLFALRLVVYKGLNEVND